MEILISISEYKLGDNSEYQTGFCLTGSMDYTLQHIKIYSTTYTLPFVDENLIGKNIFVTVICCLNGCKRTKGIDSIFFTYTKKVKQYLIEQGFNFAE